MELTQTEKQFIELLRSMMPMETVTIQADPQGKPHKFRVHREQTFFIVSGIKKIVSTQLSTG